MTIYRIQSTNFENNLVEILITDTTTTGSPVYTDLVGLGFSRKTVNNAEDVFQPIRALQATIKFKSTPTENISTFVDGDDNRYKVEATVGGIIVFIGFLVTSDLKQPYFDDPNEVTLIATDGLGGLKDVVFVDVLGFNPVDYQYLAEYVGVCFYHTGLELDFYISCNIYEEISSLNMIFDRLYLQAKTFESEIGISEDCYTVLEKILIAFGLYVQQRGGAWYINSVDEIESGLNGYWKFTGGIIDTTPIEENLIINIGSAEAVKFIQEDQILGLRRANNFYRLDYHYEYPQEIIDNINFDRGDLDGSISLPAGSSGYTLDDWIIVKNSGVVTSTAYIRRDFVDGYEKERYVVFTPQSSIATPWDYLRCNFIPVDVRDRATLSVDFRFASNWSSGGTTHYMFTIWIEVGSGNFYYYRQDLNAWYHTVILSNWYVGKTWDGNAVNETEWQTISVDLPPFPASGKLFIGLLNGHVAGAFDNINMHYQNLQFDYQPYINGSYRKYNGHYNEEYTDLHKKPNLTDEVFITDSPKKLFKGALFRFDFPSGTYVLVSRFYNLIHTPTPSDPADYYNMGKMQAIMYWNQYRRAMRTMEGSIQGLTNVPDTIWKYQLTDSNVNADNKIFQCLWFEQDFHSCEWKAGFVEVFDSVIGKDYTGNFLFKYIE